MTHHTKIALAALGIVGASVILWRRYMSSVSDVGGFSPSHNTNSASSAPYGDSSVPPNINTFGSNPQTDKTILQASINNGLISADQASQIYTYTEANQGRNVPASPPAHAAISVPPASGPPVSTASGRGAF